jgi:hypothetical protein
MTFVVAGLAACASESSEPPKAPAVARPVPMPVPVEATSDRGERTLPVSPIGRIAPEVPPSVR